MPPHNPNHYLVRRLSAGRFCLSRIVGYKENGDRIEQVIGGPFKTQKLAIVHGRVLAGRRGAVMVAV